MIKKLLLFLLVTWSVNTDAHTIKTDVLVIGSTPSGLAAAIQSARSKVKTILAAQSFQLLPNDGKVPIAENTNIPSGIWGEFRRHVRDLEKVSAFAAADNAPLTFEKSAAELVLQKMADTIKNLTIDLNASLISINKDGDHWNVHFLRYGTDIVIKARVVIDATTGSVIAQKASAKIETEFNPRQVFYNSTSYRTAIAVGGQWPGAKPTDNTVYSYWSFPIKALLARGVDNLLITQGVLPDSNDIEYLPVQFELGQGAGATAAYCAFFKTTTKNLKVRIIQGELLDIKCYLLPFNDITPADPDWRAIQQIGATGLLKGKNKEGGFIFMPDGLVLTTDIQPALTEIYTRAFLWFNKEKPAEKFTLGNTISLISDYTLTDPLVLIARIKGDWKTVYKFKLDFDLNRPVTRREFAVLVNRYLNPFARTVDLSGRLVN